MQVEVRETAGKTYVVYRASNGKVIYIGTASDLDNWQIGFWLYEQDIEFMRLKQAIKWYPTMTQHTDCGYEGAIKASDGDVKNMDEEKLNKLSSQLPDFDPKAILKLNQYKKLGKKRLYLLE